MKNLFRIFDLSKNEQRVVLVVIFLLLAFAITAYERRIHHSSVESASATEPKPSPTVGPTIDDH